MPYVMQNTNAPKIEFWKREGISINYPGGLKQLISDRYRLVERICKKA